MNRLISFILLAAQTESDEFELMSSLPSDRITTTWRKKKKKKKREMTRMRMKVMKKKTRRKHREGKQKWMIKQ